MTNSKDIIGPSHHPHIKDSQIKVKICGITNLRDALVSIEAGADALGFIFYSKSPRFIRPEEASTIIREIPPFVSTVGVFVNESIAFIEHVKSLTGIDTVQLHGDEPPEMCSVWPKTVKAFRVSDSTDLKVLENYSCAAFLLDTLTEGVYGGTGMVFNWQIALKAKSYGRIILSGGLNPDNVVTAIRQVRPYAVDVSSGVESDVKRIKDHYKIRLFIERAKTALM